MGAAPWGEPPVAVSRCHAGCRRLACRDRFTDPLLVPSEVEAATRRRPTSRDWDWHRDRHVGVGRDHNPGNTRISRTWGRGHGGDRRHIWDGWDFLLRTSAGDLRRAFARRGRSCAGGIAADREHTIDRPESVARGRAKRLATHPRMVRRFDGDDPSVPRQTDRGLLLATSRGKPRSRTSRIARKWPVRACTVSGYICHPSANSAAGRVRSRAVRPTDRRPPGNPTHRRPEPDQRRCGAHRRCDTGQ
jgi:hypothetical protein